ncbi:MAG: STAS/SEC14 domain-containing protein [Methanomicrobiaceae archaeon]|nr:STAS/SEC14 domain-containing protein [Methanomicrobiaceae archaeon]
MITEMPESSGGNLGFIIKGKLTDDDYKTTLIPVLEEAIKSEGRVNVLFKMENFEGWTAHGAWDDFINWPKFASIKRFAVLVDENWHDFATWLFEFFATITFIKIKFFKGDQTDEAWEWLKGE